MRLERTHSFDLEQATERMRALTSYWHAKYGVRVSWSEHVGKVQGKVMGFSFDATIEARAQDVVCNGPNPMLLVRGKVKQYLEHKIDQYLDPAVSVDELAARATEA